MSGFVEKTKEMLQGHHGSGNSGSHDSNVANKADARVDADRAGSSNMATSDTAGSYSKPGAGVTDSGHGVSGGAVPPASSRANPDETRIDSARGDSFNTGMSDKPITGTGAAYSGPHSSNLANKTDPRVDSDRDGSRNMGMADNSGSGSMGPSYGVADNYGSSSTNTGPHDSSPANKMDPRVDSDRDGSRNMGLAGNSGSGTTAPAYGDATSYGSRGTTTGPHDSTTTNKMDPRVDSDRDGSGNMGLSNTVGGSEASAGSTAGYGSGTASDMTATPGPARNTAGPHKSDVLNKLDPRIDSDLDGSKTIGGNKTYQ